MNVLTSQGLSTAAGAAVSILLMFLPLVPGMKAKWEALADEQKQAVNIVILVLVAVGAGLASCFGGFDFMECTKAGWLDLLGNLVYAIIGNAGVFITFGKLGKKNVNKVATFLYRK